MKRDDELPTSKYFNMFENLGNKIRLQQILKCNFNTLSLQHPEKSHIFCERSLLGIKKMMWRWKSSHQHMKADTILLYIYFQLRKSGVEDAVMQKTLTSWS